METEEPGYLQGQSEIRFTNAQIFTHIWVSPREVFRYLEQFDHRRFIYPLMIISGIVNSLNQSVSKHLGDDFSFASILFIDILAGGLFGIAGFYFSSGILHWTGKWFRGKGSFDSMLRMMAYASIPAIINLLFCISLLFIFGKKLFTSELSQYIANSGLVFYYLLILFLQFVIAIWSLLISIIGISEIQKFSTGKAILNLLTAILIIAIPVVILILISK